LSAAQSTPVVTEAARVQAEFIAAVAKVPRFTPDRFAALPPTVRQAFSQINCQVPQPSLTRGPSNVIQGEFAAAGQRDWAALCSDGSASTIRLVWGGPAQCETAVAAQQDLQAMSAIAPGVIAFDRAIGVAAIPQINRYLTRYGQRLPEPAAHDGIEDGSEKASLVYYCHAGRWLTLPGAD
jgi:hypothetical protein